MKTVKNTPVGTRRGLAHLNYGPRRRHEWKEIDWPEYSEADVARGRRFRETRRAANVGIAEMAERLGISPSVITDLDHGAARPADETEEAKFFAALESAAGVDSKRFWKAKR